MEFVITHHCLFMPWERLGYTEHCAEERVICDVYHTLTCGWDQGVEQ